MLPNHIPPDLSEKVVVALKAPFSELRQAAPDQTVYTFTLFGDNSLQFLQVDRSVTRLNPQDVIDRYFNWDPTAPDSA